MKVAIVGSRDFDWDEVDIEYHKSKKRVDISNNKHTLGMRRMIHDLTKAMKVTDIMVSGGAPGADTHGEEGAADNHRSRLIHEADWEVYGKAAGHIRNALIVKDADILFAFYTQRGDSSSGTFNCVKQAMRKHIPVYTYDAKRNEWIKNHKCDLGLGRMGDTIDYAKILEEARNQVNQSTAQRGEGGIRKDGIDLRIPSQPRPK